ncbi:hypothetical protein [Cryobacterium sp. MDB2-33-2]|uniref:hypothetical protein n=1 Tax=Cryobacterium sp. MDB2-33-2 TaxID=1259179 RepID=UPI00106CC49B|nr:hypothetical protein [Cryobacterium sp. MDB2-33-2]TFC05060.1 hypothetical protein E3O59_13050 [Cryobacterium sp. MDB2-33-2]
MKLNTMSLMPVTVPGPTQGRRSVATAERLARNAALLFGVDWEGNPVGRTWVCRFDGLTLKELSEGVPTESGVTPQAGIAAATLNRFRPDRRSAALLVGADVLFAPLESVFDEVLRTVGFTEENEPLIDEIRAAIWAVLVLECYRSQPALFVAATTARNVQRALSQPWTLIPAGEASPSELVRTVGTGNPTSLWILDRSIELATTKPSPVATDERLRPGEGASAKFLREDLISRWMKHLLESPDRGFAWVVDHQGKQRVQIFISTLGSLNAFVDEINRTNLTIDTPQERLLPRIPSAGELRRLSTIARRAVIWVVIQVHRLLRDNYRLNSLTDHRALKTKVTEEAARLAQLASDVLEPGDPLVVWARAKWRNKVIVDLRETDHGAAADEVTLLREDIDEMIGLHGAGQVDDGSMADFVRSLSPVVNAIADDADDQGKYAISKPLHLELERDWQIFFKALRIDPRKQLTEPDASGDSLLPPKGLPALLAGHLHNYAGFLSRSDVSEDRRLAIRLQAEIVVPARAAVAEQYGTTTGWRTALQVLIRILVREYDWHPDDNAYRGELAAQAVVAVSELIRICGPIWEERSSLRSGEVNTLTAILAGYTVSVEQDLSISGLTPGVASAIALVAERELKARTKGGPPSGRLIQLGKILQRIETRKSADARP